MEASQTRKGKPNFETVWAILQEIAERQNETDRELAKQRKESNREFAEQRKENDRRIAEQREKYDRELAELKKETDRERKKSERELNKRFGLYDNTFGKMLEHMVKPNLVKSFCELGFQVTRAYQNTEYRDENDKVYMELDFTLEDGDKIIIVEVKSKPTIEDIADNIERMRKVKAHADLQGDSRTYLGAIAGVVISDSVRDFTLKNGFYLVQPSGKTFSVTVPEGAYSPREW